MCAPSVVCSADKDGAISVDEFLVPSDNDNQ